MSYGGQVEAARSSDSILTLVPNQRLIFIRDKYYGWAAWSLKSASRPGIHLVIASCMLRIFTLPKSVGTIVSGASRQASAVEASAFAATSSSQVPWVAQICQVGVGINWKRVLRPRCLQCLMRRVYCLGMVLRQQ